jgi:hypothetical protein
VIFRRSRFAEIVDTQLEMFVHDRRDLIEDVQQRLAAYNRADRAEAEELYGDYVDAVDVAADALAAMRDSYARTLDEPDEYARAFNRAAGRRLPEYARELESR